MKNIKPKKKIPTIFGLLLILVALILGIFVYFYQESVELKRYQAFEPKSVQLINLSPNSFTITWQTNTPTKSQVLFGPDSKDFRSLNDDRDNLGEAKSRTTHFITLKNLKPDSSYNYQIKNEEFLYPQIPSQAKTPEEPEGIIEDNIKPLYQPISGTVVDSDLKPTSEALVFLNINGASKIGTFVNESGNFILPLKDILTSDLESYFKLKENTETTLVLTQGQVSSTISLNLPINNQALSGLQLGRNINLKDYIASKPEEPESPPALEYDLNSDGKINSIDLSLVLQNFGKKASGKVDLDSDGQITQKDVDLIQKAIRGEASNR